MKQKRKNPKTVPAKSSPSIPDSPFKKSWTFRLMALFGVTLAFFLLLEVILRITGAGFPVAFFVPNPAGQDGVMVENRDFSRRYFTRPLMRIPQSVAFKATKESGALRVFVFGESAAEGDPGPAFGFARILQVLLEDRFSGRKVEVINTAVTAINSHVIRPIALECADYQGDVWVVYMGNNEVVGPFGSGTVFGPQAPPLPLIRANIAIKTTAIGQVMSGLMENTGGRATPKEWNGMEMFLGQQVAWTDPRTAAVHRNFEQNLTDIVDAGLKSGAKLVLSTVGSNLRDCPPFASLHRAGLATADLAKWDQLFQSGVQLETHHEAAAAIDVFRKALAIDDQHAELHFRMARALGETGQVKEALEHYSQARDLDTLRFRCDSRMNEIIHSVAAAKSGTGLRLADSEAALRAASPGGIPGKEWFHEHVHLTFAGNYRIAVEMARQVEAALGPDAGAVAERPFLPEGECAARLALSDFDRAQMTGEMFHRVERPPFTGQIGHAGDIARRKAEWEDLLRLAKGNASVAKMIYGNALSLHPDDWRIHDNYAGVLLQIGDSAAAADEWKRVIELLPHRTQSYDLLGSILLEQGRFDEADASFRRALEIRADFVEGVIGRGQAAMGLHRVDDAIGQFRAAIRLDARSTRALNHLGLALMQAGKSSEAVVAFGEALQINPSFMPARLNLGGALMAAGKGAEAVAAYREAIEKEPDNLSAHIELAKALSKLGRGAEAVGELQETARRHPDQFEAQDALATMLIRSQRLDEAATVLASAILLRPDSVECRLNYGTILGGQGRLEEARAQFEEAVRLRPDFVPAQINLGTALRDLGRLDQARSRFEKVLQLEPNNSKARKLLEELSVGK